MVARRVWINPPFDMGDPRRRSHPEAEPGRYWPTPKLRSALDRLFPGGWGDACPKITSADEWSAKVTLDRASATCEPDGFAAWPNSAIAEPVDCTLKATPHEGTADTVLCCCATLIAVCANRFAACRQMPPGTLTRTGSLASPQRSTHPCTSVQDVVDHCSRFTSVPACALWCAGVIEYSWEVCSVYPAIEDGDPTVGAL